MEALESGALPQYTKALETKGWKILSTVNAPEGGMAQATKGNLMVMAMFSEKEKTASIGVSTKD